MFCNNCGKTLPEGTAFCDNCGASQSAIPAQQVSHQTVNYYNVQPYNPGKGFGVASLILGILAALLPCLSCIVSCIPYIGLVVSFLSLSCALLAIIFGIVGKSKSRSAGCKNGMATAGLVLGIICVALVVVAAIAIIVIGLIGSLGLLGAAGSASAYSYY